MSMKKFAHNLWNAHIDNGWRQDREGTTTTIVFEGEYSGTWYMRNMGGRLSVKYDNSFSECVGKNTRRNPLVKFRRQVIDQVIKQMTDISTTVKGMLPERKRYRYYTDASKEYIFCQMAGKDLNELYVELMQEPRRWWSLQDAAHFVARFSHRRDRVGFARRFFRNGYSIHKAMPQWITRIPKWKMLVEIETGYGGLDFLKMYPDNWHLYSGRKDLEPTDIFSRTGRQVLRQTVNAVKYSLGNNEVPNLKTSEWKDFFSRFCQGDADRVHLAYDALRMAHEYYTDEQAWLAGQRDGREIIEAYEQHQWVRLANFHDRLGQMDRERREAILRRTKEEREAVAREWFDSCPWESTPEFRVMKTEQEFVAEGREMMHCISMYYSRASASKHHYISINVNGERASAEVAGRNKQVRQLYGEGNTRVSTELAAAFNAWLSEQPEIR